MLRTQAIPQLGRLVELLAADAVEALVVVQVQSTAGRAGLPEALHPGQVAQIAAGADEVVERQRERLAQRGERGGVAVDELAGADPLRPRGEHVLQRVVVGAGLEPNLITGQAMMAGPHARPDALPPQTPARARLGLPDGGALLEP